MVKEITGIPFTVLEKKEVFYFCPCSRDRVLAALVTLGEKEIQKLAEKGESVNVQCHFCKTDYTFSYKDLLSMLDEMKSANI